MYRNLTFIQKIFIEQVHVKEVQYVCGGCGMEFKDKEGKPFWEGDN